MRAGWLVLCAATLVSACGGDDADSSGGEPTPQPISPLPLPPAGTSRWSTLERDIDGDGLAEFITRYEYDAVGRRTAILHWKATRGVAVGEPVEATHWTYDSASRILSESFRRKDAQSPEFQSETRATYGDDGLLASTSTTVQGSMSTAIVNRFAWRDLRLVDIVRGIGASSGILLSHLSYDDKGRISRIHTESQDSSLGYSHTIDFVWHADGRLRQMSSRTFDDGSQGSSSYNLEYDASGLLHRTLVDDEWENLLREEWRYFHDARGRVLHVETGAADGPYSVDTTYHLRWEDGPCQPVYTVSSAPQIYEPISGQANAHGTTLGCAP
jgi:hypothetical protein